MIDSEAKGNSGFPFLRHVPVLNYLFSKQDAVQEEREVLVFVTPHIWKPSMKAPLVDPAPLALHKNGPNRKAFFESTGHVPMGLDSLEGPLGNSASAEFSGPPPVGRAEDRGGVASSAEIGN